MTDSAAHAQHTHALPGPSRRLPPAAPGEERTGGRRAPATGLVHGHGLDVLGGTRVVDDVADTLRRRRGRGTPLPDDVADAMGQALGTDLTTVRVHTDREADALSRAVQARAFTSGTDVYFTRGAYDPASAAGRHLLAHELAHVAQAARPGAARGGPLTVGRADDPAEVEAEHLATQTVRTLRRTPHRTPSGQLRRSADLAPGTGLAVPHVHGPACGHESTVRRLFGLFGAAAVGKVREGEFESEDEGIPGEFVELADTIQKVQVTASTPGTEFDKAASFGDAPGLAGTTGGIDALTGLRDTALGVKGIVGGARHLREGGSFGRNLGAVEIEEGATGVLAGGGGTAEGVTGVVKAAGGAEVPILGDVMGFYEAGVKGKKAIEDSVAAARLQGQKGDIKHEQDHYLPDDLRIERFRTFAVPYRTLVDAEHELAGATGSGEAAKATKARAKKDASAAKDKLKRGDRDRYEKAIGGYAGADPTAATATDADVLAFLEYCRTSGVKEFGYGTEFRKRFEEQRKARAAKGSRDYLDARSLGKVASFGHRRKAETATVSAVESAGNALDATGTFTAAADLGATKATGMALKAGATGYTGIKSLVKRARRIHKLRTARNEMGYGGKTDRGVLWGMKMFFGGKVDDSMKKARHALRAPDGSKSGGKHATALEDPTLTPEKRREMVKRLTRKLTLQAMRRINDLIRCLGSTNQQIFDRASQIVHIVAETNLAGSIARIEDSDLQSFRELRQKVRDKSATAAERSAYFKQRGLLRDIVEKQLHGIGG